MAEREGFEPSNGLTHYTLSKRAPSATRPPLREIRDLNEIRDLPNPAADVQNSKKLNKCKDVLRGVYRFPSYLSGSATESENPAGTF